MFTFTTIWLVYTLCSSVMIAAKKINVNSGPGEFKQMSVFPKSGNYLSCSPFSICHNETCIAVCEDDYPLLRRRAGVRH